MKKCDKDQRKMISYMSVSVNEKRFEISGKNMGRRWDGPRFQMKRECFYSLQQEIISLWEFELMMIIFLECIGPLNNSKIPEEIICCL